jgi:hypothetical protein
MSTQHGPVLTSFTIYPYYYGAGWGADTSAYQIVAQQKGLTDIAAYISGKYVPAGIRTVISQYGGVTSATVAPAVLNRTASSGALSESEIQTIIANGIAANQLPNWGSNVLIMVFPASGFYPSAGVWARHWSTGLNHYYGYVFADIGGFPLSAWISHEIFEAATDPAITSSPAWEVGSTEICDGPCQPGVTLWDYNGSLIAAPFDNTIGGNCSTTGYDPPTVFDPLAFLIPVLFPK